MGYALFAQRKIVLDGQLNSAQLQQTQRSDEQYKLATNTTNLNRQLASQQASQANQLAAEYQKLSDVGQNGEDQTSIENQRASINADIQALQQRFTSENDSINNQIYQVSLKENAIELEVKRLDTVVSALQKQLEAVEDAEGSAIDRATPKFSGVG